jgi:diguanylate cyclase (GGDEF)-like protein/PAS domain S-box-containing protein
VNPPTSAPVRPPHTVTEAPERLLFQALTDPVVLYELVAPGQWCIAAVNPAYTEVTGFAPDDVLGHDAMSILGPPLDPEVRAASLRALAVSTIRRRVELRTAGGALVDAEVRAGRLPDVEGEPQRSWSHFVVEDARDEELATRHERRLHALVQHASDVVLLVDEAGMVQYASPSVERLLGGVVAGGGHEQILELLHPDDVAHALAVIGSRLDRPGDTGLVEVRLRGPDGGWRWFELAATSLLGDPDVAGIVINGRDISERRRSDALFAGELAALETMVGSHTLAPVLFDLAAVAESFIPGAACTIGVRDDDGVIRHPAAPTLSTEVVFGLDAIEPSSALGQIARGGRIVCRDIQADPRWSEFEPVVTAAGMRSCWGVPIRGAATDELLGLVVIFHPEARGPHPSEHPVLERIAHLAALALERDRFDRRLEHQALHDGLTGLPNRTLVVDRVGQALEIGRRRHTHTAVLLVDLDRFKLVNDNLGHAAGDELLGRLVERLGSAVRVGDTVGRFGGDEFAVVVEDVLGESDALEAAERMLASLRAPFEVAGAPVRISASIGVAMAGPDTGDVGADTLIRNADAAMHRAKEAGRNRVCLFEETLHEEVVRRYDLEQGLRGAVEGGELVVLYQPKVRLADGRLTGVEALIRWDRPGRGRVGADELVPVAEDTGLIVPIGAWVLEQACRQAVAWDADPATADLTVAVNLSAQQLGDPCLVGTVAATLAQSGLAARRLCLEVTESALAADPDVAVATLTALGALGVHLAIDDFGTGYATLDYVRRFSMADELKIDRSFVAGVADLHSADAAIVSAAIVLADALGFDVVAEGVETPEQLATLRRLGCGSAQGYYFGHPVPPEEISR